VDEDKSPDFMSTISPTMQLFHMLPVRFWWVNSHQVLEHNQVALPSKPASWGFKSVCFEKKPQQNQTEFDAEKHVKAPKKYVEQQVSQCSYMLKLGISWVDNFQYLCWFRVSTTYKANLLRITSGFPVSS
jgi:hypothetical protein